MNAEEIQLIMINECPFKRFQDIKGVNNAPNFFEGCEE